MKQETTLKTIAASLNLSISTVSRALQNSPSIALKTRQKVNELAGLLEYAPNSYAVQLRKNTSKLIGLIVPSISEFFYNSFIAAVEEQCNISGYSLLILQSGKDALSFANNLSTCLQNRVNGVFVCTDFLADLDIFFKFQRQKIPVIFFDKIPETNAFHKVCLADEKAGIIAARKILSADKKNILALFGDKGLSITSKRMASFKNIIQSEGTDVELQIETAVDSLSAKQITGRQLNSNNKFDCIFCMSDEILTGTMRAVLESGIKYPADIGIIAISHGFFPTLYFPEITYIETNGHALGKLAFQQMIAAINEDKMPEEIYIESVLIEGNSI